MNEFDLFIQELLGNPNPKGNMFTGQFVKDQREDDYYKNPFRMQDSIDEAMRKKLAEEAAAKATAAAAQSGMLQQGSQGNQDSGIDRGGLTADQIAFLDAETPMERYSRITNDLGFLGDLGAVGMFGPVGMAAALGSQLGGAPIVTGEQLQGGTRSTSAIQAQLQQEREAAALSARLVAEETRKREAAAQAAAVQQAAAAARSPSSSGSTVGNYVSDSPFGSPQWSSDVNTYSDTRADRQGTSSGGVNYGGGGGLGGFF